MLSLIILLCNMTVTCGVTINTSNPAHMGSDSCRIKKISRLQDECQEKCLEIRISQKVAEKHVFIL